MSKTTYIIIFVVVLLLIFSSLRLFTSKSNLKTITQKIKDQDFMLEIADTPYLLAKGLGNRQELCQNCGMLFKFPILSVQTFWMKDTLIPLDIIFIDQNKQISDIYTAQPEIGVNDSNLKKYTSSRPSLYVIELNAGSAKKLNLNSGDYLKINSPNN
ncbi:MAG: DUF192 domain-containing protein [Candidatus Shapirobacteria bacterium]|nr:DUF192 domain-containing protein [Candidatus Woesebacteria bacterium]